MYIYYKLVVCRNLYWCHGPLTRYVKLRIAYPPGRIALHRECREPFPASWRSRHASRHVRHARAVMYVGIANPKWRRKRFCHSRRMRNLQFCVYGKRPINMMLHDWLNGYIGWCTSYNDMHMKCLGPYASPDFPPLCCKCIIRRAFVIVSAVYCSTVP